MISDTDLFEDLPVNLPSFVGGETLFSWCALYHRLSGNGIAADSYFQLFGTRIPGLRHDFPKRLEDFCRRTRHVLGTPEALALERTMLGYYAPFASLKSYRRALESVARGNQSNPKHILGLMASRVGASHPLKACPECLRRDLKVLGHSRWILEHQWPSVWICRRHGAPLRYLSKEFQPRDQREWTLPEDHEEGEWAAPSAMSASSFERLAQIASVSVSIAGIPLLFEDNRLRLAYRIGAKRRGWVAFDGTLRLAAMTRHFQESFGSLTIMPGFGFLAEADPNGGGVLGLLTRQLSGLHHPAKHAVLIAFLFASMAEFVDAYRTAGNADGSDGVAVLVGEWHSELCRLVESEHWSVSRAATHLGLHISQSCRWLDSVGTAYERRPRVIDDEKRERIAALLRAGNDYQLVAEEVGVKKGLVRAFTAANPDLRDDWRESRFERLRDEHRDRAVGLFAENQGVSLKVLKSVPGNGLTWLQRHDREWLAAHAPNIFGSV